MRPSAVKPRLIHVPGESGRPPEWLRGYVDAIMSVASDAGPGSDIVQGRLANA